VLLELLRELVAPGVALAERDERVEDLAAQLVGRVGHRRLRDGRVRDERALDLERPDAVAGHEDRRRRARRNGSSRPRRGGRAAHDARVERLARTRQAAHRQVRGRGGGDVRDAQLGHDLPRQRGREGSACKDAPPADRERPTIA
jgi:hypothetical protein